MTDEDNIKNQRRDNELGMPMRVVAALLAFGRYLYLAVTNPEQYLEKGINFQTVSSMTLLVVALILLTMGAIFGRVPKKFTVAARNYEKNKKN